MLRRGSAVVALLVVLVIFALGVVVLYQRHLRVGSGMQVKRLDTLDTPGVT